MANAAFLKKGESVTAPCFILSILARAPPSFRDVNCPDPERWKCSRGAALLPRVQLQPIFNFTPTWALGFIRA